MLCVSSIYNAKIRKWFLGDQLGESIHSRFPCLRDRTAGVVWLCGSKAECIRTRVLAQKLSMMAAEWHVRPVIDSDYEQWRELYHAYREFYKQERSEDVVNTVWSWIWDPNHVTQALVAVTSSDDIGSNNKIILGGLAHHRRWPNPLKGKMCLYLDDLFTLPELRGKGIATLLINTLSEMAKKEGLSVLRWSTDKDNTTARRLYDSLGTATSKVTYDMVPRSSSSGSASSS